MGFVFRLTPCFGWWKINVALEIIWNCPCFDDDVSVFINPFNGSAIWLNPDFFHELGNAGLDTDICVLV